MKYYITTFAKKNKTFRKIVRCLSFAKNRIKYLFLNKKVNDKLIFFESYDGRSYSDSPKFIYEYMINNHRFDDYKFVWAFRDVSNRKFNDRTILVKKNSNDYYRYISMSKYWIVNSMIKEFIFKKKNQVYVQTWHGTPLKRLRYDILVDGALNSVSEIRKRNDIDSKKIDYLLSPCSYSTEKFISAFNLKNLNKEDVIVELGYPRNDSLFKNEEIDLKEKLNIKNKKVILYAPTFRDNSHTTNVGYTYKLGIDFDELKSKLGNEYVILFKAHYFIANSFDFEKYKDFVIDVSSYEELNDLYKISDLLITDYSSVFFDYAILNKPILFYMYDKEIYDNEIRGFYIDVNSLPGPIVKDECELINEIENISTYYERYIDKYVLFNRKYNYLNSKDCTKKVVDFIFR